MASDSEFVPNAIVLNGVVGHAYWHPSHLLACLVLPIYVEEYAGQGGSGVAAGG